MKIASILNGKSFLVASNSNLFFVVVIVVAQADLVVKL